MTMNQITNDTLEHSQREICAQRGIERVPVALDSNVGFALATEGQLPINGLRHPPRGETTGWYIWCGKDLSPAPDFFSPLHTRHLVDKCPEALDYLGLPPGSRFLLANDYIDIWYDASLLEV